MSDDRERDWRSWAYLQADNWPEAIPGMGPKREYGPYPWSAPTHYDDYDLDDYPHSHPDAGSVGGEYLGDVCPYCGVPLRWDEKVVLIGGTRGTFHEVDDLDSSTPAYHPDCYDDRDATIRRTENRSLDEWAEDIGP